MSRLKPAGGCLTLLSLPFFCLAVFMVLAPEKEQSVMENLTPGLFFGSVLLFPGLVLYFVGRKAKRQREFLEAVTQLVRSHDRFTVAEFAAKIGRTELETEVLINRIDHNNSDIALVFHRPTRQYMHRARVGQAQRVIDRCPHCGAPTQHEVIFPGEQARCVYCGAPLQA